MAQTSEPYLGHAHVADLGRQPPSEETPIQDRGTLWRRDPTAGDRGAVWATDRETGKPAGDGLDYDLGRVGHNLNGQPVLEKLDIDVHE